MDQIPSLHSIIYQYFSLQIHLGLYQKGEPLKSAREISQMFEVSLGTAHKALRLLEKNNLIELSIGKTAIVTYTPMKGEHVSFPANRIPALIDLNYALDILMTKIFLQGLYLLEKKDISYLSRIMQYADFNQNIHEFFVYRLLILRPLGNHMLENLFLEIETFSQFAYIEAQQVCDSQQRFEKLELYSKIPEYTYTLQEHGEYLELEKMLHMLFTHMSSLLSTYFNCYPSTVNNTKVSFHWNTYHNKPQYYYSIAIFLFHDINLNKYRVFDFLPSAASLAKKYGVSVITIRRAIALLNGLGITQSIHGKGTQVIAKLNNQPLPNELCSSAPFRNRLLTFLQCMQFITITCRSVIEDTWKYFTDDSFISIQQTLEYDLKHNTTFLLTSDICLKQIVNYNNYDTIKDIYKCLSELMLWGYLKHFTPNCKGSYPRWQTEGAELLKTLIKQDARQFAIQFQMMLYEEFCFTKDLLLSIGVTEALEVITPNPRLF